MSTDKSNIVLIGMCGAGKSTVGVLLAKVLGKDFLDTDVYIQAAEGRSLQQIIDQEGLEKFCEIEKSYILTLRLSNTVIATGGSVVYSEEAIQHLARDGVIVHLDLPLDEIERRITDPRSRGVVMEKGQTIRSLYKKRLPLYRRYADITVDCAGLTHPEVVDKIISLL